MSVLVSKYLKMSEQAFNASSDEEFKKIREGLGALKQQFTEEDWDELEKVVPTYMKPMVREQKQKYLK